MLNYHRESFSDEGLTLEISANQNGEIFSCILLKA